MNGYLNQLKVDRHEIRDGEVLIAFSNGEKLSAEAARELAMRISEELTMAEFIMDFASHQQRPDGRYH